ncbi:YciI family protein [Fusobacterium sp. PH5-44]|uniref:YciI family protein n=1 Tax=unclassified Fusobacterium TaxID=2648384 RepID=UPI003D1BD228
MFIVNLSYMKSMSEVEKHLENHMKFIKDLFAKGQIICSGKKIPRTGGIIICSFTDINEAKSVLDRDPFIVHGVANYELIEFLPTSAMCIDGIKSILEK